MTARQSDVLRAALQVGYHLLDRGASALTAVEQTIRVLEGSGLFNAGLGSHVQLDGVRRMDASLMEGRDLHAGAVASVQASCIRSPLPASSWTTPTTSCWREHRPRTSPVISASSGSRTGRHVSRGAVPA